MLKKHLVLPPVVQPGQGIRRGQFLELFLQRDALLHFFGQFPVDSFGFGQMSKFPPLSKAQPHRGPGADDDRKHKQNEQSDQIGRRCSQHEAGNQGDEDAVHGTTKRHHETDGNKNQQADELNHDDDDDHVDDIRTIDEKKHESRKTGNHHHGNKIADLKDTGVGRDGKDKNHQCHNDDDPVGQKIIKWADRTHCNIVGHGEKQKQGHPDDQRPPQLLDDNGLNMTLKIPFHPRIRKLTHPSSDAVRAGGCVHIKPPQ